jgi:beta-galactosidase
LLFIFVQSGSTLTGTAEGIGGSWAGGYDAPTPITDGQVDGANVSFRAGNSTFSGRINEDTIELERTSNAGSRPPRSPAQREASVLAVGPPPDGSDPSRSPLFRSAVQAAMVLHRAER